MLLACRWDRLALLTWFETRRHLVSSIREQRCAHLRIRANALAFKVTFREEICVRGQTGEGSSGRRRLESDGATGTSQKETKDQQQTQIDMLT